MKNAPGIQLTFDFELTSNGIDKAVALLQAADKLGIDANETVPPQGPSLAPPRTPAPAPKTGKAAAPPKGKTAAALPKGNSKAKPKEPDQTDIMDFTGDNDDDEEEELGGLGLADDDAEEAFEGTAEEAREEALAKLRVMLNNNMKAQLKEVQQIMKIAKFHDVPVEKGFEFLKVVKQIEAKIARN